MEYLKFDFKLSSILIAAFIIMTVIGTLTHELGHYSTAKILGYDASINFKSASFWDGELFEALNEIYIHCSVEIENNLDFPDKEEYKKLHDKYKKDSFWILLGGPVQTILTGTVGLLLLISFRKKYIFNDQVYFWGWFLIFLSLFWLRQVANLAVGVFYLISNGQTSMSGDEMRLAEYLGMNIWSIQIFTGIFGIGVLTVVLRLLPKQVMLTFLVSGLIGGVLGYYLWLIKFGKFILP